jgi:hypothetical protein
MGNLVEADDKNVIVEGRGLALNFHLPMLGR